MQLVTNFNYSEVSQGFPQPSFFFSGESCSLHAFIISHFQCYLEQLQQSWSFAFFFS